MTVNRLKVKFWLQDVTCRGYFLELVWHLRLSGFCWSQKYCDTLSVMGLIGKTVFLMTCMNCKIFSASFKNWQQLAVLLFSVTLLIWSLSYSKVLILFILQQLITSYQRFLLFVQIGSLFVVFLFGEVGVAGKNNNTCLIWDHTQSQCQDSTLGPLTQNINHWASQTAIFFSTHHLNNINGCCFVTRWECIF